MQLCVFKPKCASFGLMGIQRRSQLSISCFNNRTFYSVRTISVPHWDSQRRLENVSAQPQGTVNWPQPLPLAGLSWSTHFPKLEYQVLIRECQPVRNLRSSKQKATLPLAKILKYRFHIELQRNAGRSHALFTCPSQSWHLALLQYGHKTGHWLWYRSQGLFRFLYIVVLSHV